MPSPDDGLPEWKVARLKRGCEKTWREVLNRCNPWIVGFIRRRAHGRDDLVEDIVQEVWCEAIRSIDRYEVGTSFGSWLMRIADNYRRRCAYRPIRTSPSMDEWPDDRLDEADLDAEIGLAAFICDMIGLLRGRDREMITRYYLEGLDIDQVASEFGLTFESTRRAIQRARGRLSGLLEPYRLQLLSHRPRRCSLSIEPARNPNEEATR